MERKETITDLFRVEYRRMISTLRNRFSFSETSIPEDIVSDTFLSATELWKSRGIPENPRAWLYHVARNKAINYLKRTSYFKRRLLPELQYTAKGEAIVDVNFPMQAVPDGQLVRLFWICDPLLPEETQIMLAMNVIFGFGCQEIADMLRTNREVVYKRIQRAKAKLKSEDIRLTPPIPRVACTRLEMVLKILFAAFLQSCSLTSLRRNFLEDDYREAVHLTALLTASPATDKPSVHALLAFMCFHIFRVASEQDESHRDREMVTIGAYHLKKATAGDVLSVYHLVAGIGYWHTRKDSDEKRKSLDYFIGKLNTSSITDSNTLRFLPYNSFLS